MAEGKKSAAIDERRREFLRKAIKVGYVAPVVATIYLSSCQPSPSGGMMLGGPPGGAPPPP